MKYNESDIKSGIKLHTIKTEKFKTNLMAVMLTTKLDRNTVTKNALIPAVLRRGTKNMQTQEDINKKLEDMYGASFDCGLDKTGDNQVLKFYIETVNNEFLPQDAEDMLKDSINKIFEIIFNPYLENGTFKKEYVEQEKNINAKNLYEYYLELIKTCKIDIYISGIIDEKIENIIKQNENIKKLPERKIDYELLKLEEKENREPKEIQESMDVAQGKLILGLDVNIMDEDARYKIMIYNSLLGGSANSKLFQNVREKASLAYTASSSYYRFKNCGIDIPNYEKALEIIKKQIEDMKKGDFTEEEIENAKNGIISSIKTIDDEQDTEITYFFGQELSGTKVNLEEYIGKIKNVNKEDVLNVAKQVSVNTIYFLKN